MEESNRNQEKKKITIKMGGGVIGAVFLLGGAVLASAFVARKKGRSSGKDRRRHHRSPPREFNKEKEKVKAYNEEQFVFLDQPSHVNKNPSNEAMKEVESDNDTAFLVSNQSSKLDEKPRAEEINSETTPDNICDIETSEQIMCSISPKKLENDAISDGLAVIEEKPRKMMHEEDEITIHLTKGDGYNEIPKESQDLDRVHIEKEGAGSEPTDDGENKETSHQEAVEITEKQTKQEESSEVCSDQEDIKVILVDNAVEEVRIDQKEAEKNVNMMKVNMEKRELDEGQGINNGEMFSSEKHSEDGEETHVSMLDSHVMEHENVNEEERKCPLPNEITEIVKENEFIERSEEDDQMKHIEVQLVKEQEKYDHQDEIIVVEKREDLIGAMKEDKIPCDIKEEIACIVYPTPDNMQFGLIMLKEVTCPENVEVTKDCKNDLEREIEKEITPDDTTNEEVTQDDVERSIIDVTTKDDLIMENSEDEEKDEILTKDLYDGIILSDEVQLIDQEVGGKIQEDKAVEKGEQDSNDSRKVYQDSSFEPKKEKPESYFQKSSKTFPIVADNSRSSEEKGNNSERTFIKKYVAGVAMLNDQYLANATGRRIIIATLSVMSSLSCSWFFGLSFVKLCLIAFLTMILSSMVTE